LLCALSAAASAQQSSNNTPANIYTCVDAQGRRWTSDRPIPACYDREQRELGPSGTLRRVIQPSLTAAERDARAEREREAVLERQRQRDAEQRDLALVSRYPDQAAHDAARKEALALTQAVVEAAEQRLAELEQAKKGLDSDMEFYRQDPSKAPLKLRRAVSDNEQETQDQRRAIVSQQQERNRINARFDDEAKRLLPLWEKAAAARGNPAAPQR
jgi:hypothetical protein